MSCLGRSFLYGVSVGVSVAPLVMLNWARLLLSPVIGRAAISAALSRNMFVLSCRIGRAARGFGDDDELFRPFIPDASWSGLVARSGRLVFRW